MVKKITSALGKFSNSTSTNGDSTFKKDNVADFTVKKKVEGTYLLQKILYLVVFALVVLAIILIGVLTGATFLIVVFGSVSILLGWIVWFFTHRYVEIFYSYAIEDGELIATTIYGEKSDKLLLRIKMSQVDAVAPYEGEYKAAADDPSLKERINIVATMSGSDIFYALYHKDDGTKGVMLFDACEKTLKAFKYYGSKTTVIRPTRY